MVYSEYEGAKGDALRRELQLKKLTRIQKLKLIQENYQENTK